MKYILLVFLSVVLSIAGVSTLSYFDLLPQKTNIDQSAQVSASPTLDTNVRNNQVLEQKVTELENKLSAEASCNQASNLLSQIKDVCASTPFPGIQECIQMRTERADVELREENLAKANKMKQLDKEYEILKKDCQ